MNLHKRNFFILLATLTILIVLFAGLPIKDEEHAIRIAERRVNIKHQLLYRHIMEESLDSLVIEARLENGIWIISYSRKSGGFTWPGIGTPVVYISNFNGRVLLCKLDGMWI